MSQMEPTPKSTTKGDHQIKSDKDSLKCMRGRL
jgi:hypothetical protein